MNVMLEIWKLLDGRQRRQALLMLMSTPLVGFFTLLGIASAVPFFAMLGNPQFIHSSRALSYLYDYFGFASDRTFTAALGIAFLTLVLVANAVNLVCALAMNRFASRIGNHFCIALFNEYIHRDYLFHAQTNSATLLSNIVWEALRGTTGILQSFALLVTNLVTATLIVATIVWVNPLIGAAAIAALAGSYVVIFLSVRRRLLRNGLLESLHVTERAKIINESLGAIVEIIIARRQNLFRQRFEYSCRTIYQTAANTYAIAQSPRYILESIAIGGLVVVALLLIGQNAQNGPWFAQLAFLGFAAYRLLPALQQIYFAISKIRTDRLAFSRIAADLHLACGRHESNAAPNAEGLAWRGRPHKDIQVNAVSFQYAADRTPAIANASLRIAAGTTVGFVGASGSGKTTMAKLILGLLSPQSGELAVDGTLLDHGNVAAWHATVAYVPQDIFLLDASIIENIAFGATSEQIDLQRVRRSAEMAHLDAFIRTLPNGYDEILGENGVRLSGGQRQRIGIARALYRNASLLVMDESTNSLDGGTEREIVATLDQLRGELTVVLIAHRLSTVQSCDLIFEFAAGAVINCGTYDVLMRRSDSFRMLARSASEQTFRIPDDA
jgi:ATP-binding cassette, subfamily B, bacterial PglK